MVLVLAALPEGRSRSKVEGASHERRSRQAISNFLTTAEWNAPEVLQQTALEQLRRLGWRPGPSLYLLLDDTQQRKRGKRKLGRERAEVLRRDGRMAARNTKQLIQL
jgi:hypothetical protein